MKENKIYSMPFSTIYQLYIKKVGKKGRRKEEVDEIIYWLTGYHKNSLQKQIENDIEFETFFKNAPQINENAKLIKGIICVVLI
jgi:hypothetical protein